MELVDTHCHIQSIGVNKGERITRELWAKEKLEVDQVITDAKVSGVKRLICVSCDDQDSRLAIDFVQKRAGCWATIGIHPHEARHYPEHPSKLESFAALASKPKVVAVGECGLDFYYEHSPPKAQEELLRFQIQLALENKLPLIFHVRDAFKSFWPIFDSFVGISGVVHSYTDSLENLDCALARGLYIGVNGIATFAKDPSQLEVYRSVPLDRLLLETDSPFLSPKPFRGRLNQPKQIAVIAEFLAELRTEELDKLANVTTSNAIKLFGI